MNWVYHNRDLLPWIMRIGLRKQLDAMAVYIGLKYTSGDGTFSEVAAYGENAELVFNAVI